MESLDYIDEEPSYAMGAVVHGEGAVSNLEYHKDGQYLVMTTNESSIHLIDSFSGIEKKKLYAKTGGIGRLQYTHHENGILLSNSDKNKNNNFDIRYLCMYDNRYLRYFKGHTEKVTSMSMSPIDDNFLSATDKSVLLWNLSTPNPIASLQLPPYYQNSYVSYDVGGVIFGVMSYDTRYKTHCLRLFDARKMELEKGSFSDIAPSNQIISDMFSQSLATSPSMTPEKMHRMIQSDWTGFEFSGDGSKVLVNTNTEAILLLDAYKSGTDPQLLVRKNEAGMSLGACFSTDAKEIISGNEDNEVLIYDIDSGNLKQSLKGHVATVHCIRCNPKYDVFATACVNTALWIKNII